MDSVVATSKSLPSGENLSDDQEKYEGAEADGVEEVGEEDGRVTVTSNVTNGPESCARESNSLMMFGLVATAKTIPAGS